MVASPRDALNGFHGMSVLNMPNSREFRSFKLDNAGGTLGTALISGRSSAERATARARSRRRSPPEFWNAATLAAGMHAGTLAGTPDPRNARRNAGKPCCVEQGAQAP